MKLDERIKQSDQRQTGGIGRQRVIVVLDVPLREGADDRIGQRPETGNRIAHDEEENTKSNGLGT
jgi:hypothetical protein